MAPASTDTNPYDAQPRKYLRVQMEPIEIPIDGDDSILFSIVQSSIPGAHGLYFKEDNIQKALKYDSTTGRVMKPDNGWYQDTIYVNIAHGCRPYGKRLDSYTSATERFEQSVAMVQKMIEASGMYGKKSRNFDSYGIGLAREKSTPSPPKTEEKKEQVIDKSEKVEKTEKTEEVVKQEIGNLESAEPIKRESTKNREAYLERQVNTLKVSHQLMASELRECKDWIKEAKEMLHDIKASTPTSTPPNEDTVSQRSTEEHTETVESLMEKNKALVFENDTLRQELESAEEKIQQLTEDSSKKDFAMNQNRFEVPSPLKKASPTSSTNKHIDYNSSGNKRPINLYQNTTPLEPHSEPIHTHQFQQHQPQLQQPQQFYPAQPFQMQYTQVPLVPLQTAIQPTYGYLPQHQSSSYYNNQFFRAPYEEELNLKRKELDLTYSRINELENEISLTKAKTLETENGISQGFLVKKQPCGLRKDDNLITTDNLKKKKIELKKTWFEIEIPHKASDVYLVGAFTNWEVALKCNPIRGTKYKYGIWSEVPRGTIEFKFICDGTWLHSKFYQACSNNHGTLNNFVAVN